MTRMHSRDKGNSGSTKPASKEAPNWVEMSEEEVREKIVELSKEGKDPSDIGRILRDKHGVPDVKAVTGEKITEILEKEDLTNEYPEDLMNLMEEAVRIRRHIDKNPKDTQNKRSLQLTESKIKRLAKYYKTEGELPEDWFYEPERAKLIVEE